MTRIEPVESVGEMTPVSKWVHQTAQDFWTRQDPGRSRKIPMARVKDALLKTEEADRMPNALCIELLQKADDNEDGYLDYDEYMKFAESASKYSRGRDAFSKAAMTVLPRSERTVEKRSYLQHYKCCPPPFFMVLATLAEAGVFIYYLVDMAVPMRADGPAPIYSPLIYNPNRRYEAWRYLSYGLIHSGYAHLINNLVVQGILGLALEVVHGWWRIGLIYLSGILFGSLAQSITGPESYLAGASGGTFSVEYAHLGNLLLNWSEMELRWVQLVILLVLMITDTSFAIWDVYFNETPSSTGHMAHLGGALAGLTVGIYILRNFEKKKWEKIIWWIALAVYIILAITGIGLNAALPVPEFFPEDDKSPIGQARTVELQRLALQAKQS